MASEHMASEQKLPLRLLVDKEINRVIVAEASGDFIDILFSFLTLPLGTIIRLVSKNPHHDQEQDIGCINNLYHSVENSSDEVFLNQICKKMLLSPRNPCGSLCNKLKLRVDDTEEMKYFMCSTCPCGRDRLLSTFSGAKCFCGKVMEKEMKLYGDSSKENQVDGVFVRDGSMFLIFDDLRVLQSSPGNSVQQLVQLGYKNLNKLTEMLLNVGLKEILDLLKQALISKSALSDVFLENRESKRINTISPKLTPINEGSPLYPLKLKLTVTKSKRKIMYAEAEENFIDFLFSFLTTPLGSILKLLEGNTSVGSMTNLYKSVKDLNPYWFTWRPDSWFSGSPLLSLRVANQFGCRVQPLNLCEQDPPSYYYGSGVVKSNICYLAKNGVISSEKNMIKDPVAMRLFDPRSHDGTGSAKGFVKRPSLFVVWDDLKVTPLENTSTISFLQKLNAPLDDLEEHAVSIGETEALNLFGASLTSKSALTEGLFYLLRKPKEEAQS